jgi:hypothetical protein
MQGVGKSCLVLRYVRNTFDPNSKITVSGRGKGVRAGSSTDCLSKLSLSWMAGSAVSYVPVGWSCLLQS